MAKLDIQVYPEKPTVDSNARFSVGAELTSTQLRLAVLPVDVTPNLDETEAFKRTGLLCVGQHAWTFEPEPVGPSYTIPSDIAEKTQQAIREFLGQIKIKEASVERIAVGGVITYDKSAGVARVNNDQLAYVLAREFGGSETVVGSRTRAALKVERDYGAGKEYANLQRLLYVRLSSTINLDAGDGRFEWTGDRVFARYIRHANVDRDRLEPYLREFLGQFDSPQAVKCAVCGEYDCLYTFASGPGILERVPDAAVAAVVEARGIGSRSAQGDLGAQARRNGQEIDSAAVFRGSVRNPALRQLVVQAGIAVGIALADHVLEVYEPDLIVVGGTVPLGTRIEDDELLESRQSIDAIIQRTLARELKDRIARLRLTVTRSRFAGFTGLLGLTLHDRT
jgi:predicted NBD/HSP70 family sugar kinase